MVDKRMRELLINLGKKFGFRIDYQIQSGVTNPAQIIWIDHNDQPFLIFSCQVSAIINKVVFENKYPCEQSILVIPGGRSELLSYKMNHDPRLNQVIQSGWRFLKYRHLINLSQIATLNAQQFEASINQDTITRSDLQIPLL